MLPLMSYSLTVITLYTNENAIIILKGLGYITQVLNEILAEVYNKVKIKEMNIDKMAVLQIILILFGENIYEAVLGYMVFFILKYSSSIGKRSLKILLDEDD